MKLMITGDKLRIEKVSERKDEPAARDWLSDKARRQRRDASGRFAGGKQRKTGALKRAQRAAKDRPFDKAFEGEKAPQATCIVCEQCGHLNKIAET